MFKKLFVSLSAIAAGMLTVFGAMYLVDKKKEEASVGGKIMKVNYRFTKEFDE